MNRIWLPLGILGVLLVLGLAGLCLSSFGRYREKLKMEVESAEQSEDEGISPHCGMYDVILNLTAPEGKVWLRLAASRSRCFDHDVGIFFCLKDKDGHDCDNSVRGIVEHISGGEVIGNMLAIEPQEKVRVRFTVRYGPMQARAETLEISHLQFFDSEIGSPPLVLVPRTSKVAVQLLAIK